jgi:DNA mismatch repair protein MLH3
MAMEVRSTIKPLPPEVQLRLKAGVSLGSLNDAIIGLIKNSLDAGAETIRVELDYVRSNCCVEDDGVGIPTCEFGKEGGLGLMLLERRK